MKYVILLVIAAVLAPLVLVGCSGGGSAAEDNWTYVGTWVNPAYEGNGGTGPAGKMAMTSSSMTGYDYIAGMAVVYAATFAMADSWTSGGMRYFKGIAVMGGPWGRNSS